MVGQGLIPGMLTVDPEKTTPLATSSYNWLTNKNVRLQEGITKMFDDAMELFEEMKREGIERDTVTYNTLITGLGSVGRIDDAMELFEEMKR